MNELSLRLPLAPGGLRRWALAVLTGVLCVSPASARAPDPKDEVIRLEHETASAFQHKDAKAMAKLLAEDFVYRSPGAPDLDRAAFLRSVAEQPVTIVTISSDELKVRVLGQTAIITGVQRVQVRHPDGKEESGASAFTDVFVLREGRWLLTLAYGVDLPPADG